MVTGIMVVILAIYVVLGVKIVEYLERIDMNKPMAITVFVTYIGVASSMIIYIGSQLYKYFEGV